MKKIFIFIFIVFLTGNIFSQNKKISGGLYIGPGMSWISSDSKTINKNGTGLNYSFGALLDVNFLDNFAFTTGLTFNNYSGKFNYAFGASDITIEEEGTRNFVPAGSPIKYKLNYVSLPIGFKGKTNEIGYVTYFLKAGFIPMINVKTKADIGDDSDLVINKEIQSFNIGWQIGGGIEWKIAGNTRLLIELIYTRTFMDTDKTNAYKDAANTSVINPKILINDLGLKIGILF